MSHTHSSGHPSGAAVFFDAVAQHILAQHSLPNHNTQQIIPLHKVTVLLPNYHVAQPLAQSLARISAQPTLLLPQMVTLPDWAQSVPLATAITPDTCRAASLYQALRDRQWFGDADLWGITHELLALLDELTQQHVTLPLNAEDFLAQLERAYQAKRGAAMQFEARVVHELWYAMNNADESNAIEWDASRAYQQRLAQLALHVQSPIYVLHSADFSTAESRFLEACRTRVPVTIFDLRAMAAQHSPSSIVRIALGDGRAQAPTASQPTLHKQAAYLHEHHAPLAQQLRLFGAQDLEQEARAAEVQIRRWLLAGKKNIAIVAQDRLVARRVRALLERAEILVRDETGWTLSTLSVSTVLMRWLDALQSDFYYHDLLDLLKSPFIFSEQPADARKKTLHTLEQLLRKQSVAAHLDEFLAMAVGDVAVQTVLVRLRQAAAAMRKKTDTLSGWLAALQQSFDILGMGLATDEAGVQLLQSLQTWQHELANDNARVSMAEWRRWLTQQLDAHTFRDTNISSSVLLTHLAATSWRSFDAVLLLGCDDAHLPSKEGGGLWFNDAVRATLGLPARQENLVRQRDALRGLLTLNNCVLATWQASKNGETNLLSPYLQILRSLHELAYQDDLAERELADIVDAAQVRHITFPLPQATILPAPNVAPALIPQRITASGYNSLVACPYQFYARHILRLNEMDEVSEAIEKKDYGEWVHQVLYQFHQQFPVLSQHAIVDLERALNVMSETVFSPAVQRDYLARAWLLRWQRSIQPYLAAQLAMEAEGWRFQSGELPFEFYLDDDFVLYGRIDRIDKKNDLVRVLDYKMIAANALKNKLKEAGEEVQLACYAAAQGSDAAAYISIEKEKILLIEPPHDMSALAQANMQRLITIFAQMKSGAALLANGIDETCQYCEMRGLCRKSEWRVDDGLGAANG